MKLDYPEIKNWSFGITPNVHYYLTGQIYNSPKPRLVDGLHVQTSNIIRMFEEQGIIIVETKNSKYILRKEKIDKDYENEFGNVWGKMIKNIER